MRAKISLFCIALGIFFASATHSSTAYYNEISAMSNSQSIPLEGEFQSPGSLRSGIAPIIAEQQGDMLFVRFQRTVGTVQVTITDEFGEEVFTETVNAAMQPSLIISLMGLPEGNYVIRFSNHNLEMRGEFEI